MVTKELLIKVGVSGQRAALFAPLLDELLPAYGVNTPLRMRHFLAQALHETAGFKFLRELASGDAYDTRTDLGNTPEKDGDGRRYKGRGIFQTTGRYNYRRVGQKMGLDLIAKPELLEQPRYAVISAGLFWADKGLAALADRDDIKGVTKRVNGGYNGIESRTAWYNQLKKAGL